MELLNISLVCDGTSDICLGDVIDWLMDQHYPDQAYRVVLASNVIPATEPLEVRLSRAAELYQPDLILCHRDAEAADWQTRCNEIDVASAMLHIPVVPLIPVRMMESWLLIDQSAIRCAANNKSGVVELALPKASRIENIPDPKAVLLSMLLEATELPARRRSKFNALKARSRVSSFISDFSLLRHQFGFTEFEARFSVAIDQLLSQG